MEVLVTGAKGFIGQNLVAWLGRVPDCEICAIDRSHTSRELETAVARVDFVFHLAAQSYPQTSFSAPLDTLETNIQGTAHVLEVLRHSDLDPVVHVCASSEVFGRVPKEFVPIGEETTFHPASPYAISKVDTYRPHATTTRRSTITCCDSSTSQ